MVSLPSSGTLMGNTSSMINPHKIGQVMWARDINGEMVPLDLHNRINRSDAILLGKIFNVLTTYRKVSPALDIVLNAEWCGFAIIRPYLILSMETRSEARAMRSDGSWDEFWSALN